MRCSSCTRLSCSGLLHSSAQSRFSRYHSQSQTAFQGTINVPLHCATIFGHPVGLPLAPLRTKLGVSTARLLRVLGENVLRPSRLSRAPPRPRQCRLHAANKAKTPSSFSKTLLSRASWTSRDSFGTEMLWAALDLVRRASSSSGGSCTEISPREAPLSCFARAAHKPAH